MQEQDYKDKITTEVLCVLRFVANKNLLEVAYLPLEREDLLKTFEVFCEKYISLDYDVKSVCETKDHTIYFTENNHSILTASYMEHCKSIGNSYTRLEELDIKFFLKEEQSIEQKYNDFLEDFAKNKSLDLEKEKKNREESKIKLREELLTLLKEHMIAYRLKKTYEIMQQKINKGNIVAHSHRRAGWCAFEFKASEIFKFMFSTNFGYGYSSYFFLIMTYKDIDIVPYSEWVIYRYARWITVHRYSQRYELDNTQWIDAMDYTKDAYNLSVTNPMQFISKHIIGECERMVEGLENFLRQDVFELYDDKGKYDKKTKEYPKMDIKSEMKENKRLLLSFRGEKISGALQFIESIASFKDITEMELFIRRIEKCNEQVLVKLKQEIEILTYEIPPLEQNLAQLKLDYEKASNLFITYNNDVEKYKKELNELDLDYNTRQQKLQNKFPELENLKKNSADLYEKKTELGNQVTELKDFKKDFDKYASEIKVYLDNKQRMPNA